MTESVTGDSCLINHCKDVIFSFMEYRATKAETEILLLLQRQPSKSSDKSVFNQTVLEGCLVKGFVSEKEGKIFLTEPGEKQI